MATDVGVANENLRHGAPTREFRHFLTLAGQQINADFIRCRHAALRQQLLGLDALRTRASGIDFD